MDAVILIDSSVKDFSDLVNAIGNEKALVVSLIHPANEYVFILDSLMHYLFKKETPLALIRFSGREEVVKCLGDDYSGMVVAISFNKNSKYYLENPAQAVLSMVNLFEKEIK